MAVVERALVRINVPISRLVEQIVYEPHLLEPLIQCLEIDLDEPCKLMIERFRYEEGVDSLVAGGEFCGRRLDT